MELRIDSYFQVYMLFFQQHIAGLRLYIYSNTINYNELMKMRIVGGKKP